MRIRHLAAVCLATLAAACGGGGGSPAGPSGGGTAPPPTTAPPSGHAVAGVVYYDENGNGSLDTGEVIRIPGARLAIGGRNGTSVAGGNFTVSAVPEGTQTASVDRSSLPSYFEPGVAQSVVVPQAATTLALPVVLAIAKNRPNLYLAFGDSITSGDGSSSGEGYLDWLTSDLVAHFGKADIAKNGDPGSKSLVGLERMGPVVQGVRPAFTLIMYGTNDWNLPECKTEVTPPCDTVESLRNMIGLSRSLDTRPILATIPPVNTAFADRAPQARQDWVTAVNKEIRAMAAQESTVLADVHAEILAAGPVETLFVDHVHPDDSGYRAIARAFFKALSDPSLRATSATPYPYAFGWGPPSDPD